VLQAYQCFTCNKVSYFTDADHSKCPTCGVTKIEVLSNDRVREGMDAGVFFNIDPKTGKRAKRKRR